MNCCSNNYINNDHQHPNMTLPELFTQTLDDLAVAFPRLEFKPDCPDMLEFYRGISRDAERTQHMIVSYQPKPIPLVHVRVYERVQAQQVADIMRARGLGPIIRDKFDAGIMIDIDAWL